MFAGREGVRPSTFATDVPAVVHFTAGVVGDVDWQMAFDQLLALGQFAEVERRLAFRPHHFAVLHGQRSAFDLAFFGCEVEKQFSRRRRDAPQLRRHARRRLAAGCATVEGDQPRVGHHQANLTDRRVQFFRDNLGERRADVLADLDLAAVDGDNVILADVQPGAEVGRPCSTARSLGHGIANAFAE